ncbi:hypothetical protein [Aquimarina algiphila]|uniref:Uncharacterized protein n=1 Tax=Aquimarina algiphila TaxID=2047982 RepID=A0A554VRP3_9FLAO|nr:hypothetical protein [Aquimarina algiphila]TSE11327.1 hypothetical protein FOF46_01475 [Aquimarina algiphila]
MTPYYKIFVYKKEAHQDDKNNPSYKTLFSTEKQPVKFKTEIREPFKELKEKFPEPDYLVEAFICKVDLITVNNEDDLLKKELV